MALTWRDVIESPQFQALDDKGRDDLRMTFFDRFVAPKLDQDQTDVARKEWDKRTSFDQTMTLGDVGQALKSGVGGLSTGLGQISERFIGPSGVSEGAKEIGKEMQQEAEAALSTPGYLAKKNALFPESETSITGLGVGRTPWQTAFLMAAESLPGTVAMIPVGGVLAGSLSKAGALALERTAAGAAAKAAATSAGEVASYGQLAKGVFGPGMTGKAVGAIPTAAGYGAAEGLLSAGQNAAQMQEQILSTPFEKLNGVQEFHEYISKNNGDLDAARQQMAQDAANQVFDRTAVATGVIGAVTGGGGAGIVARGLEGGILKTTGKGFLTEAGQEGLQSGPEHIIQQQAAKEYQDKTIDPTKGALRATAEGAAVGGLTGVGFGVAGRFINRGETPPDAARPDTGPGDTGQAPGAGPTAEPPPGATTSDDDEIPGMKSEPVITEGDVKSALPTNEIAQGKRVMQAVEANNNAPPIQDTYPIGEMVNIIFPSRTGQPESVDRVVVGHKGTSIIVAGEDDRRYAVPTSDPTIKVSKSVAPAIPEMPPEVSRDVPLGVPPSMPVAKPSELRKPLAIEGPKQPPSKPPTAVESRVKTAVETGDVEFLRKILSSGTKVSKKAQKVFSESEKVELPTEPEAAKEAVSKWAEQKGHGEGIAAALSGRRPEYGIDPMTVKEDPNRFQFKETPSMVRATGETGVLRQETEWDATTAGTLLLWEDKSGQRFVVDGHQRLAFAKRLAAQGKAPELNAFVLYEKNGVTDKDALRIGAENNIRQATGSTKATDVARFIRAGGSLDRLNYLSEKRTFLRDGKLLARLSDPLFQMAVNDEDKVPMLAAIAKGVDDAKAETFKDRDTLDRMQQSVYANVKDKNYAPRAVEGAAREMALEQSGRPPMSKMKQQSLFDADPIFTAIGVKANILYEAEKILLKSRATYRTVAKGEQVIAESGVAKDVDKPMAEALAKEVTGVINDLSRRTKVAGVLNDTMESLVAKVDKDEMTATAAARQFLDVVKEQEGKPRQQKPKETQPDKKPVVKPAPKERKPAQPSEAAIARKNLADARKNLADAKARGATDEEIAELTLVASIMRMAAKSTDDVTEKKEPSATRTGQRQKVVAPKQGQKPQQKEPETKEPAGIDAEIDSLFDELDAALGGLKSGIDPTVSVIMAKIAVAYIKKGFVKIGPWMEAVYNHPRFPKHLVGYLKDIYNEVKIIYAKIIDTKQMSSRREVADYVFDPDAVVEPSSQGPVESVNDSVRQEGIPDADGRGRSGDRETGEPSEGKRDVVVGGDVVPDGDAFVAGEQGVSGALDGERIGPASGPSVGRNNRRGRVSGQSGFSDGGVREGSIEGIVEENTEVDARVPKSIADDLPELMPHQLQNVAKAETRFKDNHGFMITDGTGTGKTYSGAGVVKRFYLAGKKNILLVLPSDTVINQWSKLLDAFGVDHKTLTGTKDAGRQVSLTSIANFTINQELPNRLFDLVLFDESHKILSEQKGATNRIVDSLRANALHPKGLRDRARLQLKELVEQVKQANEKTKTGFYGIEKDSAEAAHRQIAQRLDDEIRKKVEQFKKEPRPKVLFLSATPFAYVKTLDYAEGFLFDYGEETPGASLGYNVPNPEQSFYIRNFGYRMRYNKLTVPEGEVDSGIMERAFHELLKKENALTQTNVEIEQDYDRKFVIVDNAIGNKIDDALAFLNNRENSRYVRIRDIVNGRFEYFARARLLEALKTDSSIKIIQDHLDMGRKVLVFHDFNEGGGMNPFVRPGNAGNVLVNAFMRMDGSRIIYESKTIAELWDEFELANPFVKTMKWAEMGNPITTLTKAFKNAAVFNGTIKKADRAKAVKSFNSDEPGSVNVIIAQSAAMSEGVSLHDRTGKHQRVMIHLGLPVKPTAAIQQEGRIYRVGMVTNALFRYLNTGTTWERMAFAGKISERIGTAENLAKGESARGLRESFVSAFLDSDHYPVNSDEGVGGKEMDKKRASTTPWDVAKSLYYAQQKTTGRRDQRDGKDYYATPEPIGLKMVEWAGVKPGDRVLEPSAGHGAISRWFPEGSNTTIIELSASLLSKAQLNTTQPHTRTIQGAFEDHHVSNKYDAIVMNPPFLVGGKMAIEHVAKAATHLRMGGRIVAIIPQGQGMERLDKWIQSDAGSGIYVTATINLPSIVFVRAGTGVRTNIVVLDKVPESADIPPFKMIDYSNRETISELFDSIENLSISPRVEMTPQEEQSARVEAGLEPAPESDVDGGAPSSNTPQASYLRLKNNLEVKQVPETGLYYLVGLSRRPSNDTWKIKGQIRDVKDSKWNRAEKRWEFPADPTIELAEILGYDADPDIRMRIDTQEGGISLAALKEAIEPTKAALSKGIATNGVKIEVVNTIDEAFPNGAPKNTKNAKGIYIPGTRTIILVTSKIRDAKDAVKTMMHELVGHFGLDMLGKEEKAAFLREVALSMKQTKNREIYQKVAGKYEGLAESVVAEEFFAYVVESAEPGLRSFADRLIVRAIGFFRKIGWMRNTPMTLTEMREFARYLARGIRGGRVRSGLPDSAAARMSLDDGFRSVVDGATETPKTPIGEKKTITVDGVDRPTVNSDGKPIHWSEEGVRNFWRWFGNSKAVDAEGRPLVMYHGTRNRQDEYSKEEKDAISVFDLWRSNYGLFGFGMYFTDSPSVAGGYATGISAGKLTYQPVPEGSVDRPTIYPVYIKNEDPMDMDEKADKREWVTGFKDVDFDEFSPTSDKNEGYFRAVEEYFEYERFSRDSAGETVLDAINDGMGYTGITHIGGGRVAKDGPRHRVHIVFNPEQIKSVTGNIGAFDPDSPDIRMSLWSPLNNPLPVKQWLSEAIDNKARRFQNRFKDIWNRNMEPVMEALILQPGRIGEAIHDFNVEMVHPLIKAIKDSGVEYDSVEEFLRARHTQEANAHLKDLHTRLKTDLGGRDENALSGKTNAWARSVLSQYTVKNLVASGKSQSEAIKIHNSLANIAGMVDMISDSTLFKWEESGMITPEKSFIYQNMFKYYVPLHREGFDDSPVQGRGVAVPSKPVKSMFGSEREVVDVIAHLVGQHEAAIILAEKADVGRAVYNWFKANPDPDFVKFKAAPVHRNISDTDVIEKDLAWMQQDHVLRVMFDGKEKFLEFNKNDKTAKRMAMALKNMTDNGVPHYMRWFSGMGHFFTGLITKFNPDFMVTNLVRDIETAFANVSGTKAEDKAWDLVKGIPEAFTAIRESQKGGAAHPLSKDLYEWRRRGGKTGFTIFYDNAHSRTIDLKRKLRMLQDDPTARGMRLGKALLDMVGNMNDALEGATRFSAYLRARESGMTENKAAVFAKEITVNFNMRGEYGNLANMLFWFFNANVQGTTRMLKSVLTSRGAKLVSGIYLIGFSVTMASLLIGGGDDDEKPEDDDLLRVSEGDEAKNAMIRFWDGDVLKIPLAWGYNLPYLAGAKTAKQLYRKINGMPTHIMRDTAEMVLASIEAFSPVGTSTTPLQFIMPSITKPFVQVAENVAWHGGPVHPEKNVFDKTSKPAFEQHFQKTSGISIALSKRLHEATKSDTGPSGIDVYPDTLDHLWDAFSGGPGRFVRQVTTITQKMLDGDMAGITSQNIPIFRRFWGLNVDGVEKKRFYNSVTAVSTLKDRLKSAIDDRDNEEKLRLLKDNAKLVPMIGVLNAVERQSKLQSDAIKQLKVRTEKNSAVFDRIRDLEKKQLGIMKNFSNSVEKAMQ